MPAIPQKTVFLERKSYRQRRLRDVARVLPLFGTVLWLLPLAWRGENGTTASTLVYIFVVWALLIGFSALISLLISPDAEGDQGAT